MRIQSVERALGILEIVAQKKEGVALTQISEAMHLALPTVHNLIRTLVDNGYVEQDHQTLRYRLGIKNYLMGLKYEEYNSFISIVEPYMLQLNEKFNESIVLSVLKDCNLIFLKTKASAQELSTSPRYSPGILHCSAVGKLLLAYLSQEEVERCIHRQSLRIFTPRTLSTMKELQEELEKIRKRGYSVMEEECDLGSCAVGVPLFNANGEAIASLGIWLPLIRFKGKRMKEIIQSLCHASDEISKRLRGQSD
jgi:DNA-binding IclR family transcriptional regulator